MLPEHQSSCKYRCVSAINTVSHGFAFVPISFLLYIRTYWDQSEKQHLPQLAAAPLPCLSLGRSGRRKDGGQMCTILSSATCQPVRRAAATWAHAEPNGPCLSLTMATGHPARNQGSTASGSKEKRLPPEVNSSAWRLHRQSHPTRQGQGAERYRNCAHRVLPVQERWLSPAPPLNCQCELGPKGGQASKGQLTSGNSLWDEANFSGNLISIEIPGGVPLHPNAGNFFFCDRMI